MPRTIESHFLLDLKQVFVLRPTATRPYSKQECNQAAKVGEGVAQWDLHDAVHATLLWAHATSEELEAQSEVFTE